ncbi:tumor necrosis factor receptor superfamily member 1A [Dromiciops gliroides]|uniref:tumor necrosis factor receptor superfamily member 1A n=1 Tax=Dromiciops gliroides TaxID=33562 RepID=UPI001CC7FC00|nr:tumor necrosis factor receptor superfamily member 1A [Dromiciops gliroides]
MGHPTLPGLVPLVALALIVGLYLPVATGMSTHQEKRAIECPQGKYKHRTNESICCLKCHKGTYLKADCGGPDLVPYCETCENGTYTDIENFSPGCEPCSGCRSEMGQVQKKPCTVSSNTVCGCRENQYQQKQGENEKFFKCVDCNPCHNGTIQRPCQEKQDAVCACNSNFFWHNQKCRPCSECTPEKKCRPSCPLETANPEESGPVLMSLVIFLGFCCLSLIFIVVLCHYSRWKSKLYLIFCGRRSPPVKEEEHQRPLASPHLVNHVPSTPFYGHSLPNDWSPLHEEQPIRPSPYLQAEPVVHRSQPSDCVISDVTSFRLDRPAVLYAVVDKVPPRRWKEFIRRLGLDEHDIELLEMQNPQYLREAHYSMLAAWQKGVPQHQATLEVLAQVLADMDLYGCLQNIIEALNVGSPSGLIPPFPS